MSVAPAISPAGEALYQRALPAFLKDEEFGWFGRYLTQAIAAMMQGLDGIVQDWPANEVPVTGVPVPTYTQVNMYPNPSWDYGLEPEGEQKWTTSGTATVVISTSSESVHNDVAGGELAVNELSAQLKVTGAGEIGEFFNKWGTNGDHANTKRWDATVEGNKPYTFSFYIRTPTEGALKAQARMKWYPNELAEGGTVGESTSAAVAIGPEWTRISVSATSPAAAHFVSCRFVITGAAGIGTTVFLDDAQLTPTPAAVTYVDGDEVGFYYVGTPGGSETVGPGPARVGHVGWSAVLDPIVCPVAWLPWCAQLYGTTLVPGATPGESRKRIIELISQKRGLTATIVAAAKTALTGAKEVNVVERFEGKAYHLFVHTYTVQTPSTSVLEAAIIAAKPAGLILHLQVSESPTWAEATKQWVQVAGTVTWGNVKKGDV